MIKICNLFFSLFSSSTTYSSFYICIYNQTHNFVVLVVQQVLDFFKYVIRILGNNIEFVVQPTIHDGMNVGVSWRLRMYIYTLAFTFLVWIIHLNSWQVGLFLMFFNFLVELFAEWTKTHMPLGKGFSFYICQIYQGKVFIRYQKLPIKRKIFLK